jgi:AraC-like DNA-binding protein
VAPYTHRRSRKLESIPIDTRQFPRLSHFGLHHGVDWERFGDHEHGGIEFFYFMDGRARVDLGPERGKKGRGRVEAREVSGGDLLAIAPSHRHRFHLDSKTISYYWFGVREGAMNPVPRAMDAPRSIATLLGSVDLGMREKLGLQSGGAVLHLRGLSSLRPVLETLHHELARRPMGWEDFAGIQLLHLLALVARHRQTGPRGRLQGVDEYLRSQLEHRLSLAELSDRCGLSAAALVRAFRRERGVTPMRYHLLLRLTEAQRLLADGLAAHAVSERLGFKTPQHFSAAFRRQWGFSPLKWAARLAPIPHPPPPVASRRSRQANG